MDSARHLRILHPPQPSPRAAPGRWRRDEQKVYQYAALRLMHKYALSVQPRSLYSTSKRTAGFRHQVKAAAHETGRRTPGSSGKWCCCSGASTVSRHVEQHLSFPDIRHGECSRESTSGDAPQLVTFSVIYNPVDGFHL